VSKYDFQKCDFGEIMKLKKNSVLYCTCIFYSPQDFMIITSLVQMVNRKVKWIFEVFTSLTKL